jgi:endonuclease/exonuclease/phosphatase family metal-dependent hydrolase
VKQSSLSKLGFIALTLVGFQVSAQEIQANKVKIMGYNVENLFDTVHDEGKEDWAYLPKSTKNSDPRVKEACNKISNATYRRECLDLDWNGKVLQSKVKNIASVISTSFEGTGPDIILMSEVENFNALQELQRNGLRNKGYKEIILIEGPDERGIDVAILSKLPLVATQSHNVELGSDKTRSILEATFQVGSKKLTVFANHWPSQSNPGEYRVEAAKTLLKAAREADARGEAVVALGDFNSLLPEIRGPVGDVLNKDFIDGIEERLSNTTLKTKVPGSHWFRGTWSFLDRIFVLRNSIEQRGLKVDFNDIDVHAPDFALRVNEYRRRDGSIEKTYIPYRFNAEQAGGYSDHLPLTMTVSF